MPGEMVRRFKDSGRGETSHIYRLDSRRISALGNSLYQYVSGKPVNLSDPTGLWQKKCDPTCPTGPGPMPPPPQNPPKPGEPCDYPNRRVCETRGWGWFSVTVCWESQCVCQCMGDSPGANCMRGCIKCADDNGAPGNTIEAEEFCQSKCKINLKEKGRLVCCTTTEISNGGCLGNPFAWKDPPPRNPPPGNKCFNNNK